MECVENKLNSKIIKCPNCGSDIEVTEGYVQWCEHCSWNLKPYEEKIHKETIVDKIYRNLGEKLGKKLFESMVKSNSVKHKISISKLLAYVISIFVFSISIISIALSVYMIYNFGINVVSVLLSLCLLGLAIAAFPRFGKLPKGIVSRSEFPALYKLLDSITEASNTKKVYGIVIDREFNASYAEVGIRRRKIVRIGLPLYCMLNDKEKVALLSHEIAHGVNGDSTRGLITCTALNTLVTWYQLTFPGRSINKSILDILTNLIMLGLSKIILFFIYILVHLIYSNKQRAEYLADYIGASISGTEEMKSMLDKLHLHNTYWTALNKAVLNRGKISFFSELQTQLEMIPEKELKRIRLVERMEDSRLDDTHPPTAYRISFMEQKGSFSPKVILSEADSLLIDKELVKVKKNVERWLVDYYRGLIYG